MEETYNEPLDKEPMNEKSNVQQLPEPSPVICAFLMSKVVKEGKEQLEILTEINLPNKAERKADLNDIYAMCMEGMRQVVLTQGAAYAKQTFEQMITEMAQKEQAAENEKRIVRV